MRLATTMAGVLMAGALTAQVPDGWYVWCSFQSSRKGETGVFFSHPRNPGAPIAVTGLTADLKWVPNGMQGASCVVRRQDGVLLVGERAPKDHSVDLHLITLNGNAVYRDQLISLGTSAAVGEVPQCAALPGGKILAAATDLASGPLANYMTQGFNYEGIGIVDPIAGNVTPIKITNGGQLPGVINGLTASKDGKTCYFGTWVSATQGDIYALPIAGGAAVKIAQVPAGFSNMTIDQDGKLLIATLNGPPNLYRLDLVTQKLEAVTTANGPLNAVAVETVTGHWVAASANAGIPARSVFWIERTGKDHLLTSPDKATISGIDVNPNPERFGPATPGPVNTYDWALEPNAGGLPLAGNTAFSLTLVPDSGLGKVGILALGLDKLAQPIDVLGMKVGLDPAWIVFTGVLPPAKQWTIGMPLPGDKALIGAMLFLQSFHNEGSGWAASCGLELTIL